MNSLLENIQKRGREYELSISKEYLKSIQDVYFEYFRMETSIPVVVLDVDNVDFVNNQSLYEEIVNCINTRYLPGFHQVILSR